ncbi:MAG TPA: hypothetical protein VKU82_13035 [Planctomycetaceae bacterium]|nr:hypothetical protein [Planctomycetaceae bacterium]
MTFDAMLFENGGSSFLSRLGACRQRRLFGLRAGEGDRPNAGKGNQQQPAGTAIAPPGNISSLPHRPLPDKNAWTKFDKSILAGGGRDLNINRRKTGETTRPPDSFHLQFSMADLQFRHFRLSLPS